MDNPQHFKRSLGLIDATSLVAGSMIGSGIFLVSTTMSRDLGSSGWLLVAWLLSGIITCAAALSYGELAGMMPDAGGQYVYIRRAWGKLPAFLYGWTVFAVVQTGVIAAVAVAFAKYAGEFFPLLDKTMLGWYTLHGKTIAISGVLPDDAKVTWQATYGQILAVGTIVLLTFINARGVKSGALVQKVFTSAKVLALLGLIVLGLAVGLKTGVFANNFHNAWSASRTFQNDNGEWVTQPIGGMLLLAVFGMTMINSLFSSDAWNNVTFIAGEIREPQKNIPRSLILGTGIVTILYMLANIAYLALLPLKGSPHGTDTLSLGMQFAEAGRVGTAAATMIFGTVASAMMAVLIMISTFGCNNGIVLSGARLYYAMAKDDLFFKKAKNLNKHAVPSFGLWIQCAWASALCFSGTYSDLVTYATFANLLFYIMTISGVFILRKKEPGTLRPYKSLGYPVLPAFYILAAAAICIDLIFMDSRNTVSGLIIVAIGLPVYYAQRWWRKK